MSEKYDVYSFVTFVIVNDTSLSGKCELKSISCQFCFVDDHGLKFQWLTQIYFELTVF